MSDIEYAGSVAIGLRGEAAALVVECEGDWVPEERFAGPCFADEAWAKFEGFSPLFIFAFGFCEKGFAGTCGLLESGRFLRVGIDLGCASGEEGAGRKGQDRGGAFHEREG